MRLSGLRGGERVLGLGRLRPRLPERRRGRRHVRARARERRGLIQPPAIEFARNFSISISVSIIYDHYHTRDSFHFRLKC